MKKICALVLGSYINAYSIVQELYEKKVPHIGLVANDHSLARYSNKLDFTYHYNEDAKSLLSALHTIQQDYDYIVLYPTNDIQLELILELYDDIKDFCFCPINHTNLISSLDKNTQYLACEALAIPYPKSIKVTTLQDLESVTDLQFPILVKPSKRDDLTTDVFRNLYLEDFNAFTNNTPKLCDFIEKGVTFVFSEFVPGDDTNIYAYTAYRSKKGEILNDWIGKKLTQYPDKFGVFSSAANLAPEIIREQGQKLIQHMDIYGIVEPEFKYDARDSQYKLMEINLRSMMWHRLGNLTGVNLQYTQYLDAVGETVPRQLQKMDKIVHLVYLKHEITNLLSRWGYIKHFKHNLFGGDTRGFAAFDKDDLKPFIYDSIQTLKTIISRWLRILKIK